MRSQLKNSILPTMVIVSLVGLCSCGWSVGKGGGSGTPTPVSPHTPGSINATLKMNVGGGTSIKCTAPQLTWTASSPAGSPQTNTSPAIAASDNVMSQCSTYTFEGTTYTECYCPVSVLFTSLAPGTWTVQAPGTQCSVKVNPGQTTTATLFTGGKPCTTIP